jgi:hypothetical protein
MKPRGMARPLMGKFSTARWVCAPHKASAGTLSSPMLSCSTRKEVVMNALRSSPRRRQDARPDGCMRYDDNACPQAPATPSAHSRRSRP